MSDPMQAWRPRRPSLLLLLLSCALLALASLSLPTAAQSSLVPVGGCALGSRILRPVDVRASLVPRARLDGSSSASSEARTVLFTGSPIRAADTLRAFDFYVARAPAQLLLQVYRPVGGGAASAAARRLQLVHSLPVSVVGAGPVSSSSASGSGSLLQGSGVHRVAVQWRVQAGDVLGVAWAGSSAPAPALPFDAPDEDQALRDESWVTLWAQANTRVGDSLTRTPQGGSVQRIYSFAAYLDSDCVRGGYLVSSSSGDSSSDSIACGGLLSSSLHMRSSSDEVAGISTLLVGQAVMAGDRLSRVTMLLHSATPFLLQLWARSGVLGSNSETFQLRFSVLVEPTHAGLLTLPLDWPVAPTDVLGLTSASRVSTLPLAFDSDSEQSHASLVYQFRTASEPADLKVQSTATLLGRFHRHYSVRMQLHVSCAMQLVGTQKLLPSLPSVDQAGASVLLFGQAATSAGFLTRVQLHVSRVTPLLLQLWGSDSAGGVLVYTLRFTQRVTPSAVGLLELELNWPMVPGDVLAYAGASSSQQPSVNFVEDSAESPATLVHVFDSSSSNVGATLSASSAVASYRRVSVQAVVRPYGLCSGAALVPEHASIGSCTLLQGTAPGSTCSYACAPGYKLRGEPLRCLTTSSRGELTGSQSCEALPCSFSLSPHASASLGTCNSTMAVGTSCNVQCNGGTVPVGTTSVRCEAPQTIHTTFQRCAIPRSCALPTVLPKGATFPGGNCTAGAQMQHDQVCQLVPATGWEAIPSAGARLRCWDGELSPMPIFLPNPCHLTSTVLGPHVLSGECGVAVASGAPPCALQCEPGFILTGQGNLTCVDGVVVSELPRCDPAPSCLLPVTPPVGAELGSCEAGGRLNPIDGSCTMRLLPGFQLGDGSLLLTCRLGVLSPLPVVIPKPCTLPVAPKEKHAEAGACPSVAQGIVSGMACDVSCQSGYESSDSPSFSCDHGVLSGSWPSCKLPTCQLPLYLPDSLDYGTCSPGSLLRADGDGYVPQCTLQLQPGYAVDSGSLTMTCSRAGELSALPVVSATILPTQIRGDCASGPANWATRNELSLLVFAGALRCPSGQALLAWDFDSCTLPDETAGLALRLYCSPNRLLVVGQETQVQSPCIIKPAQDANHFGTLSCPDDGAVVGLAFQTCNGAGSMMVATCASVLPAEEQLALLGSPSVAGPRASLRTSYNCLFESSSLQSLLSLFSVSCSSDANSYMRSLQVYKRDEGKSNACLQQRIMCMEYTPSQPGVLQSYDAWYGSSVESRPYTGPTSEAHCTILPAHRITRGGWMFAARVWAKSTGDFTIQSYEQDAKGQFVVRGSYTSRIRQLGWQQIGLPESAQWEVDSSHYLGFCQSDPATIVPSDTTSDFLKDYNFQSAYSLLVPGAPVRVGELAGGGGSSVARTQQHIYSVQFGVRPKPVVRFGFNTSALLLDSKAAGSAYNVAAEEGDCLLLDQPRLATRGLMQAVRVVLHSTKGKLLLQSYREEGEAEFKLQGSVMLPTPQQRNLSYTIPLESRWEVESGDLLAICYTKDSPRSHPIFNPLEAYLLDQPQTGFPPYVANGRAAHGTVDQTTPRWWRYTGGIQRTIGEPVSGLLEHNTRVNGLSGGEAAQTYSSFAVEVDIEAGSACTPLGAAALGGFGNVTCDARFCHLECQAGYASAQSRQRCRPDGTWETQGQCVRVDPPTLMQAPNMAEWSNYAVGLLWKAPTLPPGVVLLAWELATARSFPLDGADMLLPSLLGVQPNTSDYTVVSLPPTQLSHHFVTDSLREIEGVGVLTRLRMRLTGGTSVWVEGHYLAHCSCDVKRALELSNPELSLLNGWPLDVSVHHTANLQNQLLFTLTPNSLCTDSYELTTEAVDGTELGINSVIFNVFHADNANSCSFFNPTTQSVTRVAYPMYGRELSLCVTPRAMHMCGKCAQQYNTGVGDPRRARTPVCVRYTPSFVAFIEGEVTTEATPLAPIMVGIGGVNVTAYLTHPETGETMYETDDDGTLRPVQVTVMTDDYGKYKLTLASAQLSLRQYGLRVYPHRVDIDSQGNSLAHTLVLAKNQALTAHEQLVGHNDFVPLINFYDKSQVPLTGKITLSTRTLWYGRDSLQGCGRFNLTVRAYEELDVKRERVLSESTPTGHDGAFQLSATMFSVVILVPVHDGVNRTFDPPFLRVQVGAAAVQLDPIFDVTEAELTLQIDGGSCGFNIGSVRPTLFFDACGPSAQILLPAFAGGAGYTYRIPAVSYTVKLFDSKNPFSGLQSIDLDGTQLPNAYLGGDVFDYIATRIRPFAVDYMQQLEPQSHSWRYRAQPDFQLATPPTCLDRLAPDGQQTYDVAQSMAPAMLTWRVTDSYGYVGTGGENRLSVCGEVETAVDVLDGVTEAGTQLYSGHVQEGCSTGDMPCRIASQYNNRSRETTITYRYLAGPIQQSDFRTDEDNTAHTQPAYSRTLQWRLSGSVLPWKQHYVVITGSTEIPGSLSLPYPPHKPLYILRDPPGGSSSASLGMSRSLTTATIHSLMDSSGVVRTLSTKLGSSGQVKSCIGQIAGTDTGANIQASNLACDNTWEWEAYAFFRNSRTAGSTVTTTSTDVRTLEFAQNIATSSDPELVDGQGDLFLTVAGSYTLAMSRLVAVSFDTSTTPTTCTATSRPAIQWEMDQGTTFQWISAHDVENVVVADLKLSNRLLLQQHGAESLEQLKDMKDPADLAPDAMTVQASVDAFGKNLEAIAEWKGMLAYNEQLKGQAEPWPAFYDSIRVPGKAKGQVKQGAGTRPNEDTPGWKEYKDMYKDKNIQSDIDDNPPPALDGGMDWNALLSNRAHGVGKDKDDKDASSITFFGGGDPRLSFTITASSSRVSQHVLETGSSSEKLGGGFLDVEGSMVLTGQEAEGGTVSERVEANDLNMEVGMSNELVITLGDPDPNDMFHVEVRRDPVFGSPVYVVTSGQSMCQHEQGTMAREMPELLVRTSMFTHVHPKAAVSTTLQLLNKSPTEEEWEYGLVLLPESNPNGLKLSINGHVLTASSAEALKLAVPYNIPMQLTLVAERGPAAFDYSNIKLQMHLVGSDGGGCQSSEVAFSVQYDEPCAQISFAGPLAVSRSFTVNSANVERTGAATLMVLLRNPQVDTIGRKWKQMAASTYLQEIRLQFRAAATDPQGALSDADWQDIKVKGDTVPPTPLLKRVVDGYASVPPTIQNDVLGLEWDMSSMGDGAYELRALTQCKVPAGALDTSLYTSVTPTVVGTVDTTRPQLFGAPLPAANQWYPGGAISATFTKPLACNSYFGAARVQAWINPTLVAGPQSAGRPVATLLLCRGSTLHVSLFAPVYDDLVGRLLTVRADRLFDKSGNAVQGDSVEWSFQVAFFDVAASAVRLAGLRINGGVTQLLLERPSEWGTQMKLQTALSSELARLINAQVDRALAPTPPASASADGIQPGSVQVSEMHSVESASQTSFVVTLNQLPRFPGDAPAKLSPSLFASSLQQALRNGSFADATAFPLLSRLTYQPNDPDSTPLTAEVRAVATGAAGPDGTVARTFAIRRSAATMAVQPHANVHTLARVMTSPSYLLQALHVGLGGGAGAGADVRATLQLSWLVEGEMAVALQASDVRVEYELLPDSTIDPDDAASAVRVTIKGGDSDADGDVPTLSLVSNVQSGRAAYQLQLLRFPTRPGGYSVRLLVHVSRPLGDEESSSGDASLPPLYTVDESTFVLGPPASVAHLEVVQPQWDQIEASFMPSVRAGHNVDSGDADVAYVVSLLMPSSSSSNADAPLSELVVPAQHVRLTRAPTYLGLERVTALVHLSSLAGDVNATMLLRLPQDGATVEWQVAVTPMSPLSHGDAKQRSLTIRSLPAPLRVYRVSQLSLDSFELRFSQPADAGVRSITVLARVSTEGAGGRLTVSESSFPLSLSDLHLVAGRTDSNGLPLWSSVLRLPAITGPYADLSVALLAHTDLGTTAARFQRASLPAFVSPPQELTLNALNQAFRDNATVQVRVTWRTPQSIRPLLADDQGSLLHSFDVAVSYSDGSALLGAERVVHTLVPDAKQLRQPWSRLAAQYWSLLLPLQYTRSPIEGRATTYSVIVRARIHSTSDESVHRREDGTGAHLLLSDAATAQLVMQQPASSSSGQITSPTGLRPSSPYFTRYPLEGTAESNAPPTPVGLQVQLLPSSSRARSGSPDASNQVRVAWPAVNGASTYVLSWFSASNSSSSGAASVPLGAVSTPASQQVDGVLVTTLNGVLLPTLPTVGADYKLTLASVSASGAQSQRIVQFLHVDAPISSEAAYDVQSLPAGIATPLPVTRPDRSAFDLFVATSTQLKLKLFPVAQARLRSVHAVFLHHELSDYADAFPSCQASAAPASAFYSSSSSSSRRSSVLSSSTVGSGSVGGVGVGRVLQLSACSQFGVTLHPLVHLPNVLYLRLEGEDMAITYSAIFIHLTDAPSSSSSSASPSARAQSLHRMQLLHAPHDHAGAGPSAQPHTHAPSASAASASASPAGAPTSGSLSGSPLPFGVASRSHGANAQMQQRKRTFASIQTVRPAGAAPAPSAPPSAGSRANLV